MGILKGLLKITLSPLNGISEIFDDLKGENGEDKQGLAILTLGTSSVIKGTLKGIKKGTKDIFKE